MPKYQNISGSAAFLPGYQVVAAGQYITVPRYVRPLPAAFTLLTHDDAPWVKLHAGVLPAALTSLAGYGQIVITNDTGDTVTVQANDDSTNVWTVLSGQTLPIEQDHELDKLDITGSGGSNLYVYGLE